MEEPLQRECPVCGGDLWMDMYIGNEAKRVCMQCAFYALFLSASPTNVSGGDE